MGRQVTLADVAREVFRKALAIARERLLAKYGSKLDQLVGKRDYVTREDLEQAIIALRYEQMEVTLRQLDMQQEQHRATMRELERRQASEVDRVDATIVPRDGSEVFRSPWPNLRKR
jgi:hypothetical protein